jgi:predicted nucleic acid-binding protein
VRERPSAPPSITYIESSALVAAFLEADVAAQRAIRAPGRRVTSALTVTEAHRAVLRGRVTGRLTLEDERDVVRGLQTFARRCELVAVSNDVLVRAARPFPVEPIRSLDAIHLATIELLGEPPQLVTVVTRDSRVGENARALGYAVA